jgi:integrase
MKKKVENRKLNQPYVYPLKSPMELDTLNSAKNLWVLGVVNLNLKIVSSSSDVYKLLVALDPISKKVLNFKLYAVINFKEKFDKQYTLSFLKKLLGNLCETLNNEQQYLIIHTSSSEEFNNTLWEKFFIKNASLIHSTDQDPDLSYFLKIWETTFFSLKIDLSSSILAKNEQEAVKILVNKIKCYNSFTKEKIKQEENKLQLYNKLDNYDTFTEKINASSDLSYDNANMLMLNFSNKIDLLTKITLCTYNNTEKINFVLQQLEENTNKIGKDTTILCSNLVKRRNGSKPSALLRRDGVNKDLFKQILETNKQYKQRSLPYSRFILTCTILYFTGMRISEIGLLTKNDILHLLHHGEVIVKRSKNNDVHKYKAPTFCKDYIPILEKHIQIVFTANQTVKGSILHSTYIKSINKKLKHIGKKTNKNLKSHSFRIGYVNTLLNGGVSIHDVSQIVGHSAISCTEPYIRFKNDHRIQSLVTDAFNK